MRIALLALPLVAACAMPNPYANLPPGYVPPPPPQYVPYQLPAPYQMPTTNAAPPPTVTCTTRTTPGLGGPTATTTCR